MVVCLIGEHCRDSMDATTSVFRYERFAYATATAPTTTLEDEQMAFQYYLPSNECELLLLSHGESIWQR